MWGTLLGLVGKVSGGVWIKVAEYLAVFFLGVVITHQLEKGDIAKLQAQMANYKAQVAQEKQAQAEATAKQMQAIADKYHAAAVRSINAAATLERTIGEIPRATSTVPCLPPIDRVREFTAYYDSVRAAIAGSLSTDSLPRPAPSPGQ